MAGEFARAQSALRSLARKAKLGLYHTPSILRRAGIIVPHHPGRIPLLSSSYVPSYMRKHLAVSQRLLSITAGKAKEMMIKAHFGITIHTAIYGGKRKAKVIKKKKEPIDINEAQRLVNEFVETLDTTARSMRLSILDGCYRSALSISTFWVNAIQTQTADVPIKPKSGATMILHPEGTEIPLIRTGKLLKKISNLMIEDRPGSFVAIIGIGPDEPIEGDPELGDAQSYYELMEMLENGAIIPVNDKIRRLFAAHGITLKATQIIIPPRPYFKYVCENAERIIRQELEREGVYVSIKKFTGEEAMRVFLGS